MCQTQPWAETKLEVLSGFPCPTLLELLSSAYPSSYIVQCTAKPRTHRPLEGSRLRLKEITKESSNLTSWQPKAMYVFINTSHARQVTNLPICWVKWIGLRRSSPSQHGDELSAGITQPDRIQPIKSSLLVDSSGMGQPMHCTLGKSLNRNSREQSYIKRQFLKKLMMKT